MAGATVRRRRVAELGFAATTAGLPIVVVTGREQQHLAPICSVLWLGIVLAMVLSALVAQQRPLNGAVIARATLRCCVWVVVATAVSGIALVLLGAPVFNSQSKTLWLAFQIANTVATPAAAVFSSDAIGRLIRAVEIRPERGVDAVVTYASLGAIFAAWVAASALPLDWDVWWQQWPLPCSAGLLIGNSTGVVTAILTARRLEKPVERSL